MFYESELRFVCDALEKCHIQTHIIDMTLPLHERLGLLNMPLQLEDAGGALLFDAQLPATAPGILYRLTDPFHCHYLYCSLPSMARESILAIGPYLTEELNDQYVMEWAEQHGVSPSQLKYLHNYYSNVPMVQDPTHLFALLETFGERLWGPNGFTVEDVAQESFADTTLLHEKKSSEEDTLWHMRTLEQRYAYETELMDAITKGQTHKADLLLSTFSHMSFEQRATDPLRNTKNYCIIMNTLLRKAAEQGGVHPLHLDSVSSAFAVRIEQIVNIQAIAPLMTDMFHTYCRLVRKHSLKGYSPPVQKAITFIEADLAGNLNLRTLSQSLNISSSYLSSLFKKETGQTLTDYIAQRRMSLARHLLLHTKLQVQTIAQHCGILDVHYFSKLFKKATGMTPKEFRQSAKS